MEEKLRNVVYNWVQCALDLCGGLQGKRVTQVWRKMSTLFPWGSSRNSMEREPPLVCKSCPREINLSWVKEFGAQNHCGQWSPLFITTQNYLIQTDTQPCHFDTYRTLSNALHCSGQIHSLRVTQALYMCW